MNFVKGDGVPIVLLQQPSPSCRYQAPATEKTDFSNFFLFSTYLYYSLFPPFPHQSNIRPLLFLLFLFLEQCSKGANVRKHVLASHIWTEQVLRWNHLCRVERCEVWWKAFSTIMTIIKFKDSKSAFWLQYLLCRCCQQLVSDKIVLHCNLKLVWQKVYQFSMSIEIID